MKHLILTTLILLSLKSWADGGNGVERMELPAEVRVRVTEFLASHCGIQADNSLSVAEYQETEDTYEVAVVIPVNSSEQPAVVRMRFAKKNALLTGGDQMFMVDPVLQSICK